MSSTTEVIRLFKNTRTGASDEKLVAYKTEDEMTAMARLKAAGWNFNIDYYWDEATKTFHAGKKPDAVDEDGEQDE